MAISCFNLEGVHSGACDQDISFRRHWRTLKHSEKVTICVPFVPPVPVCLMHSEMYTECVDMILDASSMTRTYLFRSRETHPASCEISEALWILHLFDFAVVQLLTLLLGHVTFELENFAKVLPRDLSAA